MKVSLSNYVCVGVVGLCVAAQAQVHRTSQMVGFASGNLGAVGTSEGWEGSNAEVTVASGNGSLDGTAFGLASSAGEMANVSANDGFSTRNLFATSGQFPVNTAQNLYYSFLYRFNNAADVSADGERLFQVNRQNSGSAAHFTINAKSVGEQIQIGVGKPGGTVVYATANIAVGQVALVVVRQQMIVGGGDDIIDLWVNPPQASLSVDEGSVPEPSASTSEGTEDTSNTGPGRFYAASGANGSFDELRIGAMWLDVTPSPVICNPPVITTEPVDATVTAGLNARFSVAADGTSPSYKWETSADGNTWTDVAGGSGAFTPNYTTPNLTLADNGRKYRAIVNVACGALLTATSAEVTVTVNAPVLTTPGVIVDDVFNDGTRNGDPFGNANSLWFASSGGSLDASSGVSMIGVPAAGSSVLWVGYFTDDLADPQLPAHIDVGQTLKATLVFVPTEPSATPQNVRFGLFDYADGGTRILADGFGSGSTGRGENVRGYMLNQTFGATFNTAEPMEILARNNLTTVNLMGTTGAYASLGSGPDGDLNGQPAFVSGTEYTLEFSVARTAENSVDVTTTISGGGSTWTHTETDSVYAYHRFDAFAIRPNTMEGTASQFEFKRFKVELAPPTANEFRITSVERPAADTIKLTWEAVSGRQYQVQARDSLSAGNWAPLTTVTADGATASYTDSGITTPPMRFYRISSGL